MTVDPAGQDHNNHNHSMSKPITVDTSKARTNTECVRASLQKLGWKEYPNGRGDGLPCDIYWHAIVPTDMKESVISGKVNKFPGMHEIVKKVSLTRSLATMQKLFPNHYDFYPKSWFLPAQLEEFYEDYYSKLEHNPGGIPWYIVKPDDGAQGTGIYLLHSPDQLKNSDKPHLIQEYISDIFLFADQRLKFDFRVYAVIKSINPLSIFVAREGMARFCTSAYRPPSVNNSVESYIHLTNYSLNKLSENYVNASSLYEEGSKRLLSSVFCQLESRGINIRKIWHAIKVMIVKTVIAIIPEIIIYYENQYSDGLGPHCFQILGFDILLTKQLQPLLLEVNACPSLSLGHQAGHNSGTSPRAPTPLLSAPAILHSKSTNSLITAANTATTNKENIIPSNKNDIISVVDQAIKLPLVHDTLMLVMDQQPLKPPRSAIMSARNSRDDTWLGDGAFTLSEIFPAQYGQMCSQLLILHRAAFLFLHLITARRSMHITMSGCRHFIRKCQLQDIITITEIDNLFCKIQRNWEGFVTTGLPFHGFMEMFNDVACRKFQSARNVAEAVCNLLSYCEEQLSYHGVISSSIRLKYSTNSNDHHHSRTTNEIKEIYLLPNSRSMQSRPRSKSSHSVNSVKRQKTLLPKIK